MILARLSLEEANEWRYSFLTTVLLTHWILPYATASTFLPLTKVSKKKGLQGRMTWFSTVLQKPGLRSLGGLTYVIQQRASGSGSGSGPWLANELIYAYEFEALDFEMDPECRSDFCYFQLGFQQDGTTLLPTWEAGQPLTLQVMAAIQHKSLDELDSYIQDIFTKAEAAEAAEAEALAEA